MTGLWHDTLNFVREGGGGGVGERELVFIVIIGK